MKKIAYLITAYKDFETLYELSEMLTKTDYVFIHVDEKSKTITDENIAKLNSLPGCRAIRKYRILWGSFTHVQAILELMMLALSKEDVGYIHMLTGEDYPIVPLAKISEMFADCEQIYMGYIRPEDLPESVTVRYRYYNWFQNKNVKNKLLWSAQDLTTKLQDKVGVRREGIGEFGENQIYKGLVYISMPAEAGKYVVSYLAKHPDFWSDLEKCQVPEEFLFQTIFMNSQEWREKVVDKELRYMDWTKGDGSSPSYLTETDYPLIEKAREDGCIFARKFHPLQSVKLREKLRQEIFD